MSKQQTMTERIEALETGMLSYAETLGFAGNTEGLTEVENFEDLSKRVLKLEGAFKVIQTELSSAGVATNESDRKRSWKSTVVQCVVWQRNLGNQRQDAKAAAMRKLRERVTEGTVEEYEVTKEMKGYITQVLDRHFPQPTQTKEDIDEDGSDQH